MLAILQNVSHKCCRSGLFPVLYALYKISVRTAVYEKILAVTPFVFRKWGLRTGISIKLPREIFV